jgi:hypothetical protein
MKINNLINYGIKGQRYKKLILSKIIIFNINQITFFKIFELPSFDFMR